MAEEGVQSRVEDLLRKAGYSDRAIRYYLEKENVGILPEPCVRHAYTGPCGDTIELFLLIDGGIIKNARFEAIGGVGAFISSSALTTLLVDRTVEQAERITTRDILEHLGALPEAKTHCALLAVTTLKRALKGYHAENA